MVQFIDIQLSSSGNKSFAINYFIFPLFPYRAYIGSNFAGRFPRGKSGDGWWPAKEHIGADDSMVDVVEKFHSFGLPIFDTSLQVEDFIQSLEKMPPSQNCHILRDYAFSLIYVGNTSKGLKWLEVAKNAYRQTLADMPTREWCTSAISECDILTNACSSEEQTSLFAKWIEASEATLKIKKSEQGA